jgi:hypothetical protein
MSEEERRLLQQQLWNIANTLRGKMGADELTRRKAGTRDKSAHARSRYSCG